MQQDGYMMLRVGMPATGCIYMRPLMGTHAWLWFEKRENAPLLAIVMDHGSACAAALIAHLDFDCIMW